MCRRVNPDEATTDWRAVCVMWPSELCGACVAETHSYLAHDCRAPHNVQFYRAARNAIRL